MKNSTFAASFVALTLFHLLPDGIYSFTMPTTSSSTATIRRSPAASITTNLHGLPPLPGFLTRNKASSEEEIASATAAASDIPVLPGQGAISNNDMTTESALETTGEEEQQLSETQTLLQKVKQAGTAGGEYNILLFHCLYQIMCHHIF